MGCQNCMLTGTGLVSSNKVISCAKGFQVLGILQLLMQFLITNCEVTVPVKCKLTVPRVSILASRDSILDSRKFRESSLESSFENFEDRESSCESRN